MLFDFSYEHCNGLGILSIPTFEKLLARVLLEKSFVGHRADEILEHEQKDRLDVVFGIARILCEGSILCMSAKSSCQLRAPKKLTHSPRSRIKRARYIDAAAMWLGW